ncbi:MAG TPA: hypothetical protein VGN80_02400 [Devosiaceae bacterium]|nr:hypothetical protein [Devosiaceae bacterium]
MAGVVIVGVAGLDGAEAEFADQRVGVALTVRERVMAMEVASAKARPPPSLKVRPFRDSRMSAMVFSSSQRVPEKLP